HSRDALAGLLWPETDQSSARGALRRTLSALNQALGGQGLEADRESVGLSHGPTLWSDVAQFYSLLSAGHVHTRTPAETCAHGRDALVEAVTLYRDDFLAGFSLRDSPDFDDWQRFQAERMRHDLASALEQ